MALDSSRDLYLCTKDLAYAVTCPGYLHYCISFSTDCINRNGNGLNSTAPNKLRGLVLFINILTWLQGFQGRRIQVLFGTSGTKETHCNKFAILSLKHQSHVKILIKRNPLVSQYKIYYMTYHVTKCCREINIDPMCN